MPFVDEGHTLDGTRNDKNYKVFTWLMSMVYGKLSIYVLLCILTLNFEELSDLTLMIRTSKRHNAGLHIS